MEKGDWACFQGNITPTVSGGMVNMICFSSSISNLVPEIEYDHTGKLGNFKEQGGF